jgi:hypothetical protein
MTACFLTTVWVSCFWLGFLCNHWGNFWSHHCCSIRFIWKESQVCVGLCGSWWPYLTVHLFLALRLVLKDKVSHRYLFWTEYGCAAWNLISRSNPVGLHLAIALWLVMGFIY